MCGIAGIVGNRMTEIDARLARMSRAILHRGPDDKGQSIWPSNGRVPQTAFAHRRLSIIDLSEAGHQPMSTSDGRFTIIYNGEIYNYRVLRRELQTQGVDFASQTHTEDLFIFASELRALLESGLVPRRLSRSGLTAYLQTGSVTEPGTMVEGVRSLQSGHYATILS